MSTVADRIREKMTARKVKQVHIVEATGASKSTVSKWLSDTNVPKGKYLNKLADFLATNSDWLLTGEGADGVKSVDVYQEIADDLPSNLVIIGKPSEFKPVKVEYLDIKASCGNGYKNCDYPQSHSEYLTVEFLRENDLPIDGKGIIVMHACNDSMGYTIPDGSLIVVNTNDREFDNFVNNKIYVFLVDGEFICKRAVKKLDGTVILKSDNADKETYPDQEVTRTSFNQFELFGRVHWVSNKV